MDGSDGWRAPRLCRSRDNPLASPMGRCGPLGVCRPSRRRRSGVLVVRGSRVDSDVPVDRDARYVPGGPNIHLEFVGLVERIVVFVYVLPARSTYQSL